MKKSFILIALLLTGAIPALAGVDIKESTSPKFLYNSGHSDEAIRLIQYNKAYANGLDFRAEEEAKVENRSFMTKFLDYLDPARDDGEFFNRSLQLSNPGYDDL